MSKPKEILELEKHYNISLKAAESLEVIIRFFNKNIYYINEKQEIVGLNLSDNKITDIKPLEGLTALTELNLSDNQITDINQFKFIESNKKLNIRIIGNPFEKNSNYNFDKFGNNYDGW